VLRDGKPIQMDLTLNASASTRKRGRDLDARLDGDDLADLDDSQRRPGLSGSLVKAVERSSRAYASGLRADDVIIGVNQRDLEDTEGLATLLRAKPRQLLLTVVRGQGVFYLLLQ
jgi:serine protease DegQ